MEEKIYNLFYFVENHKLLSLGLQEHIFSGKDDEKIAYLKSKINSDYKTCNRIEVVPNILVNTSSKNETSKELNRIDSSGINISYFEELLEQIGAPRDVLFVITPVVDGKPTVQVATFNDFTKEYIRKNGFEFDRLINDDYFDAIKILYNEKKYVSCAKLIVSFIDTISYLEYGDVKGSFVKWLNLFSQINKLGITAEQLWEFRNSILHMTNLDSRKILSGKEKKINFIVAKTGIRHLPEGIDADGCILFNLFDLILTLSEGVQVWIESMNNQPEKYEMFFKRYNTILSDRRISYYYFG